MNNKHSVLISLLFVASTFQAATLKNEFIEVTVNDFNQRIEAFQTLKGDAVFPSDDNHILLQPKTPTINSTYVYIDGKIFKMGKDGKPASPTKVESPTRITSQWKIDNVLLTQIVEIIDGETSQKPDTLLISYFIQNMDEAEHELGMRVIFDTFIGPNDSMPFLVPGKGVVITERKVSEIPDYFIGLDSLLNPFAQFQATLIGKGMTSPDSIVFANSEKLDVSAWEYTPVKDVAFKQTELDLPDSGYALYWGPIKFPPVSDKKSKKKVATKIGLYNSSTYKGEALDLSIGGPLTILRDTFTIVALVQNKDLYKTVKNSEVSIDLPPGSVLLTKLGTTLKIPEIKPDAIKFLYYTIQSDGIQPGEYPIKLTVKGEFNNSVTFSQLTRKITKP